MSEKDIELDIELKKALEILRSWLIEIGNMSGHSQDETCRLWDFIKSDAAILREFAYYHDRGEVLGEFSVQGYTLADIMIWQIDHFRSHMDRLDNDHRYNHASLLFDSFIWLVKLSRNPEEVIAQFASETGTDLTSGWTIG